LTALQAVALVAVAVTGTATALTRDLVRQAMVAGVFGTSLGLLFFAVQAPDVALSQIIVASVALPLMILLAVHRTKRRADPEAADPRSER
jgi:energy-converting hydrogenase B subunit D